MLYKFKSAASGDLIMLKPDGDALLRVLQREPATRGIIEVEAMPEALRLMHAAMAAAKTAAAPGAPEADEPGAAPPVGLPQRLWPMVQMLEQALAARVPVVWGV